MGPGPTVRHTGGLSRSQGTSPGRRRRRRSRPRAPQPGGATACSGGPACSTNPLSVGDGGCSHLPAFMVHQMGAGLPPPLPLFPSLSWSFVPHTPAFSLTCSPTIRRSTTFAKSLMTFLLPRRHGPRCGRRKSREEISAQAATPADGTNQGSWPGPEQGSPCPPRDARSPRTGQEVSLACKPCWLSWVFLFSHSEPQWLSCLVRMQVGKREEGGHTPERQTAVAGPGRQDGACCW